MLQWYIEVPAQLLPVLGIGVATAIAALAVKMTRRPVTAA